MILSPERSALLQTALADAAPHAASVPVPAWLRRAVADAQTGAGKGIEDIAIIAGAAIGALDAVVRGKEKWAGAWRQRLALKCAAAAIRLAGRSEDKAALRDAWYLRPADGDPGPAGTILAAWRQLAARPPVADIARLAEVVEQLGLHWDNGFADLPSAINDLLHFGRPSPFVAAVIATQVVALSPGAELLAWWCADLILAQKLRWQRPVPLLMAQVFSPAFRATSRGAKRNPAGRRRNRARGVPGAGAGRGGSLPAGRGDGEAGRKTRWSGP